MVPTNRFEFIEQCLGLSNLVRLFFLYPRRSIIRVRFGPETCTAVIKPNHLESIAFYLGPCSSLVPLIIRVIGRTVRWIGILVWMDQAILISALCVLLAV